VRGPTGLIGALALLAACSGETVAEAPPASDPVPAVAATAAPPLSPTPTAAPTPIATPVPVPDPHDSTVAVGG
jgi:hypothetical protein